MQKIDIFKLAGFFPAVELWEQKFERKIKRGEGTIIPISRLTRAVCTLLLSMFTAQILADAFHYNLGILTGISPQVLLFVSCLCLPILLLLDSRNKKRFRNKHDPGA